MEADAGGVREPGAIDWSRVRAATYRIEQRFRYEYPGPIRDLRQRLVLAPPRAHGAQRRLGHRLSVSVAGRRHAQTDGFGNVVAQIELPRVERAVDFTFQALVRREADGAPHTVDAALLLDPRLTAPRRLTRPDEALLDAAADLRAIHPNPADLADAISRFVHRRIVYTKGVSDVFTTAATAFAMGRGVCQDYAHVMLALARACGLPARYVSGHLLGEGATHAWVEVLVRRRDGSVVVLAFDPTHDTPATVRHVVVAVGRDYEDVAPVSGTFDAPYPGVLRARHRVDVIGLIEAA
ncbi:MAG TPA: transglutaminase family protein [Candidatus Sulfotelmatobacter sp.]|nr:transglutaminase family protein [Candidatus Sulfotelmatobacter sp.]